MARRERDFNAREAGEQAWLRQNTWCDECQAADLGMRDPIEYEEEGLVYVEGTCLRCGSRVVSEIQERDAH